MSFARSVQAKRPVPAWRPLAGLIRSLSAVWRDPSQCCRSRFQSPDRHRSRFPQRLAGGRSVCVELLGKEPRGRLGVEPICKTLGVSASAYYQRRSGRRSARAVEDERLLARIRELHASNYYAYGYRRMWRALRRAGEQVPRCQVQRLMKASGIVGAKRRGKPWRTTRPDPQAARRPDLVQCDFSASRPNELWVADISYLRCWEGLVSFAF